MTTWEIKGEYEDPPRQVAWEAQISDPHFGAKPVRVRWVTGPWQPEKIGSSRQDGTLRLWLEIEKQDAMGDNSWRPLETEDSIIAVWRKMAEKLLEIDDALRIRMKERKESAP
jgi:hypothetical protein